MLNQTDFRCFQVRVMIEQQTTATTILGHLQRNPVNKQRKAVPNDEALWCFVSGRTHRISTFHHILRLKCGLPADGMGANKTIFYYFLGSSHPPYRRSFLGPCHRSPTLDAMASLA
jgi:hypothetical protein